MFDVNILRPLLCLQYLCECQFDDNVKFKTAINEEDPDKMRLQPIGRDKDGQMYWFQLDQDDNVRVYVEEQDDLDGSSWKCIVKYEPKRARRIRRCVSLALNELTPWFLPCRDRNDLAEVVALLKTQIDPELLKREQENKPEGKRTVTIPLMNISLSLSCHNYYSWLMI